MLDPGPGALQQSVLEHDGRKRRPDGELGVRLDRERERGLRKLGDRDRPHGREPNQGE